MQAVPSYQWLPEVAQRVTDQLLTANADDVDAIVCSSDAMAGGVTAALAARGLEGTPVSGQDGDHAALNRIALGTQAVTVWKDSRELGKQAAAAAVLLASGTPADQIPGARPWDEGPRGLTVEAVLLEPLPITSGDLDVVIDAGWVSRDVVCRGAGEDQPAACAAP